MRHWMGTTAESTRECHYTAWAGRASDKFPLQWPVHPSCSPAPQSTGEFSACPPGSIGSMSTRQRCHLPLKDSQIRWYLFLHFRPHYYRNLQYQTDALNTRTSKSKRRNLGSRAAACPGSLSGSRSDPQSCIFSSSHQHIESARPGWTAPALWASRTRTRHWCNKSQLLHQKVHFFD